MFRLRTILNLNIWNIVERLNRKNASFMTTEYQQCKRDAIGFWVAAMTTIWIYRRSESNTSSATICQSRSRVSPGFHLMKWRWSRLSHETKSALLRISTSFFMSTSFPLISFTSYRVPSGSLASVTSRMTLVAWMTFLNSLNNTFSDLSLLFPVFTSFSTSSLPSTIAVASCAVSLCSSSVVIFSLLCCWLFWACSPVLPILVWLFAHPLFFFILFF